MIAVVLVARLDVIRYASTQIRLMPVLQVFAVREGALGKEWLFFRANGEALLAFNRPPRTC